MARARLAAIQLSSQERRTIVQGLLRPVSLSTQQLIETAETHQDLKWPSGVQVANWPNQLKDAQEQYLHVAAVLQHRNPQLCDNNI